MNGLQSLQKAFADDFVIGAAVNPRVLQSHKDILLQHFGSLTAENQMKPAEVQPAEGQFTFDKGDIIADFAKANHMQLRGHTLVWHNQTAPWVFQENGGEVSRETALKRMETHIHKTMSHYKGIANTWDVVNEAVNDHDEGDLLRDCPWKKIVGEDYLAHAFRFAKDADGDCRLCYNDYNEVHEGKSKRIYELVKGLRGEGVPVDVIGMQGHYNCYGPSIEQIRTAMELYISLGVSLQVTELDVSLFHFEDKSALPAPTEELLALQAEYYGNLFKLYKEYKKHIDSVTLWGVADDATWLSNFPVRDRKNWPLLFDDNHQPKAAFHTLMKL